MLLAVLAASPLRPSAANPAIGNEQPRPRAVLIRDVAVWDGESEQALPHPDVLIRGRFIEAVGPNLAPADAADAERIDGGGRTLIPGLSDAHRHLMLNLPPV